MLRLATAMGSFWSEWGHYAEGCEWLRASLALPGADARSSARAGALLQLAWVAQHQGARGPEHAMLAAGIAEALSIYRELSDPAGVARALELSGRFALRKDDFERFLEWRKKLLMVLVRRKTAI